MAVRGTVVRVGNVKPLVTRLVFECLRCTQRQVLCFPEGLLHKVERPEKRLLIFFLSYLLFDTGKYVVPTQCVNQGCTGQIFSPLRTSPETEVGTCITHWCGHLYFRGQQKFKETTLHVRWTYSLCGWVDHRQSIFRPCECKKLLMITCANLGRFLGTTFVFLCMLIDKYQPGNWPWSVGSHASSSAS